MKRALAVLFLLFLQGLSMQADQGMWLLNKPPRELLKKNHSFEIPDGWLDHLQLSSVRFNNGGSGSFVSAEGLVVTNHHIGAGSLQKVSPKDKDYYRDGFHARKRSEEIRCPDLELNVLQSIEDVTERVEASVKGKDPKEAFAARRAVLADIEKESLDKTKLRSDVVTLYQGGMYHLYRYKKYTDVRLVWAPEHAIASFGGDVDNFEYPRCNLDVCFFRVYENDKPAKIEHFLRWNAKGPSDGDLVFVTGHPGRTNRQETLARLLHRRDVTHPYALDKLRSREALLRQFSERGPEFEKMARRDTYSVANARKAITGQYEGLLDPAIIKQKSDDEQRLRDAVNADPAKKKAYGDAWQRIEASIRKSKDFEAPYHLYEGGDAFDSRLFSIARQLVRLAAELPKNNADRLREYRDSNLDSLKFQLFSPAPIYPDLERTKLAGSLSFLCENLGGEHDLVKKALAGKPPAARAADLTNKCTLADVAERKRLFEGGAKAIEESRDPMIQFARLVDDTSRALRKRHEDEVEEVERQAYGQIAKARFELEGTSIAPDATFTLRLAFGKVRGYEVDGEKLLFHTTFGDAFERAAAQKYKEPFDLPKRWLEGKAKLDLKTPFNFVSTSDTIGGNSGSPVVNRKGELVGINFDRNRHGLVRNFVYTDEQARHISVHSRAVLEALRKLYDGNDLVKEINPVE